MNQQNTSDNDDEIVWGKGDVCLSPYTGDGKLYRAVVQKIRRDSITGDVKAVVTFSDYDSSEQESVPVGKLKRIKKSSHGSEDSSASSKRQLHEGGTTSSSRQSSGFFKPLFGTENCVRLDQKYREVNTEEDYTAISDKLSSSIFVCKNADSSTQPGTSTPVTKKNVSSQLDKRKGVVASGGKAVDLPRKERRYSKEGKITGQVNKTTMSPEPSTSKDLSPVIIVENTEKEGNTHHLGFDEEDMEKPHFSFPPVSAKVPYLLSEQGDDPTIQVPATLNQYLRDYQRVGIRFLYRHYSQNRGGLLGDDMGLGKTVQVIGFLSALMGKQGTGVDTLRHKPSFIRQLSDTKDVADNYDKRPFLIIGPGCVLYNWLDELETWGYFSTRKYHGAEKVSCLSDVRKGKVEVVVTTFETYRDNKDALNSIDWNAVIVDEVHKIKGLKAQATQALRGINTLRRFGLTGTALQNNLLELWSLADWAQPRCLGTQAEFEKEYVQQIERGQKHDASKRELALARKKKEKFAQIRKSLMLRRMKSIISDQLPKKDDNVVFCRLSQLQTSIYKTVLSHRDMQLVLHMDDLCDCGSRMAKSRCCYRKTSTGTSVRAMVFTFMHLLLKVANHVALLIPHSKSSDMQVKASMSICREVLEQHPSFITQTKEAAFRTLSDPKFCGKMKILQGLLGVFSRDHSKVLLFSYSTQVLNILEQYMMSTGYEYRRIDGSTPPKKRLDVVREFNKDPNIFICLISTKAGGLGLNLTGANRVVIFDPNWNPAHDLQAQDRAYRIGQRRNVQVYRLVSAGTIEENMYLRQIYKQQLLNVAVEDENARRYFTAVQGDRTQKGELFGVKNMFRLQTGSSCLTMDILKRNDNVETNLMGYQIAEYIPPVLKEEEGDSDDPDTDVSVDSAISVKSENLFADFFSSQSSDDDDDEMETAIDGEDSAEQADVDSMDIEYEPRQKKGQSRKPIKKDLSSPRPSSKSSPRKRTHEASKLSTEPGSASKSVLKVAGTFSAKKRKQCLQFVEVGKSRGDAKNNSASESESSKGKSLLKNKGKSLFQTKNSDGSYHTMSDSDNDDDVPRIDQTLAGTFSDVGAVFDQCGVLHIHENVKVVGGSKAEDHMSRCAITDVYELHQNSQEPALYCEPLSESSSDEEEEEPIPLVRGRKKQPSGEKEDHNTVRSTVIGQSKVLVGQTPRAIKMIQYEQMCEHYEEESKITFAENVLRSSVDERVKLLNDFYGNQDPALSTILVLKQDHLKTSSDKDRPLTAKHSKNTQKTGSQKKVTQGQRKVKVTQRKGSIKTRQTKKCGLVYNDFSDSASLGDSVTAKHKKGHSNSSQDSSMVIGVRSKTPAKQRQILNRTRVRSPKKTRASSKRQQHTMVSPSYMYSDLTLDDDDLSDVHNSQEDNMEVKEGHSQTTDTEELLGQLGKSMEAQTCQDTVDGSYQKTTSETKKALPGTRTHTDSVLNDLFSISGATTSKRKPPPSKRKNAFDKGSPVKLGNKVGNKTEVNSFWFNTEGANSLECSKVDDFLTTSTLKDDNYDCFEEPSKWKTMKHKSPKRGNKVEQLISDSDTEYQNLFATGKLKKRDQNKKKPSYATPSLFDSY